MDDVIADLHVKVPDPAEMIQKAEPFQSPVLTVPVNGVLSGVLIALSVEIFRWRGTIKQVQPKYFYIFIIIAGIFIAVGLLLGLPMIISFISF
ncbi:MAG: hypothetical protein HY863_17620 [Chloroflexi bacterium]|nr:hypothetical protein [Chloroflexota bacterium]